MLSHVNTLTVRALPVWIIAIAAALYGADAPLASLVLSLILIGLATGLAVFARPAPTVGETGAAILLILAVAMAAKAGWLVSGVHEYAVLAACGAIVYAVPRLLRTSDQINRIVQFVLVLVTLLAFAAFIDFIDDPATQWGRDKPYGHTRFSTPFLSANTAATFYGSMLLLALGRLLQTMEKLSDGGPISQRVDTLIRHTALPAATILTCGTVLFLTASRGGITACMIAAFILIGWQVLARWRRTENSRRAGNALWIAPAFLLIVAAIYNLSGALYASRLESDISLDARFTIFAAYADAIWLRPLFGHGLGGFAYVNDFIARAGTADTLQTQGAAHNIVFQWLLQAGIAGSAVMAAVVVGLFNSLREALGRRRRQKALLRTIFVIGLFMLAHGMVDYGLEIPAVSWTLACLFGLGRAIAWRSAGQ